MITHIIILFGFNSLLFPQAKLLFKSLVSCNQWDFFPEDNILPALHDLFFLVIYLLSILLFILWEEKGDVQLFETE